MSNPSSETPVAASTSTLTPSKVRLIKGMIADSSGHSDFSGSAEDATALIKENVQKHNKWVFIDNEPVFPQNDADFKDIQTRLETTGGEFLVTAKLQGGQ